MYIGRKTCCARTQLIYGQPTCISFCLHRRVSTCRVLRTHIRYFVRQHTWISFCLHRHVSALKLPGARICPCARQSRFTHRHQVLGRHICAARKRLHKQGLKTIGTKTCFAHIHTYPPARKDSAGETISAVRLGLVTQLLLRGHTWVSRRSHGNIVCIYKISVSTYCCFAVALSVPRAALPRNIFTATTWLQKQGLKTIGTKPCNASIHTYIRPAHMDLILLAQTCYVLGSNIFTARKRLQKQGPKAMYIGRKTCCARTQLIYGQPTWISFCLHRHVKRAANAHMRIFFRQHTWISFCLRRHVSALKLPGAVFLPRWTPRRLLFNCPGAKSYSSSARARVP